ncbi:MAG TPA: peptide MFS transporter [Bacteroidia bacterium]|nr:peptide MFS transporter [Bacteroidia bacterium]MBP7713761.1 peptide MFS transporter [Bacteroidia bacterium]MBP8667969.1 peptide MFS transporter [Bacteroidia bacterium]HOZ81357.1 peptide MFS transporter [Bacteroidia bacterium]HOZ89823.1 peptide MFS transporter [Bacteroidia bacterium]
MNKKHPKALPYLFLSEMWERFGFYLMLGIFFLYMTDTQRGGMAMDRKEASDIFGTFIALVYLTPFVGGLIADRVLGYRVSITLGGILMGIGYCGLAIPGMTAFYVSLLLIIIGNGFFKPNISTILGNVYNDPEYKPLKDSGYNIFYMGINIGAFICNFFGSYLRNNFSWGAAFAAAGIGMFVGVIIFWIGNKHYAHADVRKPVKPEDMPVSKILGITLLPALIAGYIGWIIPENIFGSDSTDAFILGALPVAGYYVNILLRSDKEDRRPLAALLAVFAVAIVFWAVFKQNGTALTTWAESYTNREVPQSVEPVAKVLGVTQTVTFSKDSVPLTDSQFRVARDENKKAIKTWDYPLYYKNVPADKLPKEGESLTLISTELGQSINPFWVVILTPVIVAFWAFLKRRNSEPSTTWKIFYGFLITSLSTLVMVAATYACHNGLEKSSMWWLIASYGVITVGELCLSPMALSLVSKLSPPRLTALMMGGWFLSTSIGNKLSGVLASMWDEYEHKANFFLVNFTLVMITTIIILLMLKWLNKIVKEHGA